MAIKRVFTSGVALGGDSVDVVGYLLDPETNPTPDVTVYLRGQVLNLHVGMSPVEARLLAVGLIGAADAADTAAREARTVPLPLAEVAQKPGIVAALVLLLSLALNACQATAPAAPPVETVGSLTASYRSIAVAPVAKSTDLATAFQAVDSDDGPAVAAGGGEAVAPDVTAKVAHGF
jgi:hypothetical protein